MVGKPSRDALFQIRTRAVIYAWQSALFLVEYDIDTLCVKKLDYRTLCARRDRSQGIYIKVRGNRQDKAIIAADGRACGGVSQAWLRTASGPR